MRYCTILDLNNIMLLFVRLHPSTLFQCWHCIDSAKANILCSATSIFVRVRNVTEIRTIATRSIYVNGSFDLRLDRALEQQDSTMSLIRNQFWRFLGHREKERESQTDRQRESLPSPILPTSDLTNFIFRRHF